MKENRYPHVFQPLTVRGLTLKNRLQYAPTVVLKCTPDGQVGQEMLDFMKWQASTRRGLYHRGGHPGDSR